MDGHANYGGRVSRLKPLLGCVLVVAGALLPQARAAPDYEVRVKAGTEFLQRNLGE